MNKKLIVLAIASAFAAPVAMADNGNVVIYGTMGVSVDSVDADGGTEMRGGEVVTIGGERRGRVSSNNSNIGFKGTEDLGGGLSAIWQLETALQMDQQGAIAAQGSNDSQGGLSRRNTFVGLKSTSLGALTLGTQESPLKTSTGPLDVFANTLADYRSVFTKLSTRADNSVLYTSPNMGGFVMKAMYGMRNEAGLTATDDSRMYALSGVYKNGPLYATLAYEDNEDVVTPTSAPAIGNAKNNAWRAGVGYAFGDLKLGLAYENNDAENAAGVTTNDGDAWYLSGAYKMGANTLKAAYTQRGDYTSGSNNGADQWTIGADHAMSKRTSVYALYTEVSNDGTGRNGLGPSTGIAQVSTIAGGDASGFSLGMVHKF